MQCSVDVDVVEVCAIIVQKTENGGKWWCGKSSKCARSFLYLCWGGQLECGGNGLLSYV